MSRAVTGVTATIAALLLVSCASRPLDVDLVVNTGWTFDGKTLTGAERALVTDTALATLRSAFDGFAVTFHAGTTRTHDRVISIEDTALLVDGPGPVEPAGTVGATRPLVLASSVRIDNLMRATLAAVGCRDLDACATHTRAELLRALGHGVGATAAHELGHQVGLRFSADSDCDDCYDGGAAVSRAHFFGPMRWSEAAQAAMARALPRSSTR